MSNYFQNMGFRVYMVPEAAGLLITGIRQLIYLFSFTKFAGGAPFGSVNLNMGQMVQFQANLMKTQIALENSFIEIGNIRTNSKFYY
jgi:hypothetical protein